MFIAFPFRSLVKAFTPHGKIRVQIIHPHIQQTAFRFGQWMVCALVPSHTHTFFFFFFFFFLQQPLRHLRTTISSFRRATGKETLKITSELADILRDSLELERASGFLVFINTI
jgi:hypothetical protein